MMMLYLKVSYKLSYRACEGMTKSLLKPHGIKVPSYVTLSRKMQMLSEFLLPLSTRRPETVLVDSSGFKVLGEGEWKTKIHGRSYKRTWVKAHISVDSRTNEIVDLLLTSNGVSDARMGIKLVERLSKQTKCLVGDGAYDSEKIRLAAYKRGVKVLAPPPEHARLRYEPHMEERSDSLRVIYGLGGDRMARKIWAKLTGYNHRVKVESAFSRLKRLFGERLFSRQFRAMNVELWFKALISNMWLKWGSIQGF